jgi:hypothetical protein
MLIDEPFKEVHFEIQRNKQKGSSVFRQLGT